MKKYIIAVSGGPDSMYLLNKYKKQIFCVCHVNYNKRKTAIRDTKIVESYCKKNNIKLHVLNVTKKIYNNYFSHENNFQSVARKIRYDFFLKIANKYKIYDILIAHNLNDFLETAYIQKENNSLSLYYGIKKNSVYKNLIIFRPLINILKKNIQLQCDKKKIPYGIDETNFLDIYKRNKIRKIINSWSKEQLEIFINEIKNHNKKNKLKNTLVEKHYKIWKGNDFSKKYFKTIKDDIKINLVYNLLQEKNVNVSKNKLENIVKFYENSAKNKTYRIGKNIFLK